MKTLILLVIFLALTTQLHAQYNTNQNKVWAFGFHAGLDFNSGVPVPITTSINTYEGCATVCDPSGNLLFYTDGTSVYDRSGSLMPSGASIFPVSYAAGSTTQAAVAVPVFSNPNQYYIFSLACMTTGTPGNGRLAYCIVDMTLNGALGDVIAGTINTLVDSNFTEGMTVTPGTGCSIWLLVHRRQAPDFWAYKISATGINAPVISTSGSGSFYDAGVIKVSHDSRKIVMYGTGTQLHDFDPATGIVSNYKLINSGKAYSAEFSPDNTKLYAPGLPSGLYQYDITLPTAAAIAASKINLAAATGYFDDFKLGPDNKIYFLQRFTNYLNCIPAPNLPGTACGFVLNAVDLSPNIASIGLPNVFVVNPILRTASISGATSVCVGSMITLSDGTAGGSWSSGSANASVSGLGIVAGVIAGTANISYTVTNSCGTAIATKTIAVMPLPDAGTITGPPSVCIGSTITLSDPAAGGVWSSGSARASVTATGIVTGLTGGPATISYSVTNACGTDIATKTITIMPLANAGTIKGGPSVCNGSTSTLSDPAAGGVWSSGSAGVAPVGSATGIVFGVAIGTATISYTVTNACGTATATKTIAIDGAPPVGAIAGLSSVCVGSSITLTDATPGGTWSNTNTTTSVVSGIVRGLAAGTDTIRYTVAHACGPATVTKTVTVNPLPNAGTIMGLDTVCPGATVTLIDAASGGTGSWGSGNTAVATVAGNVIFGVTAGIAAINYIVTNSCGNDTATKNITVNPLPDAGTIAGPQRVCVGSSITLTENAPAISGTSVWSSSDATVAAVSGRVVTGITSGTAIISYTIINSCGTATAVYSVTVDPLPSTGNITGSSAVCIGGTITLSDDVTNGSWSGSRGVTVDAGAGSVTGTAAGPAAITFAPTSANGCTAITTFTVSVLSSPTFTIGGVLVDLRCRSVADGSILVTVAGGTPPYQYTWQGGNTTPEITNLSAGTHTVEVKELATQCVLDKDFIVHEPDSLLAAAEITKDSCAMGNGTITLTATGGTIPYAYLWSDNSTGSNISGLKAATYSVTITDAHSCTKTMTMQVQETPCQDIIVHDVITPNGDGINDTWIIDGLQHYPGNTVQVFDKYGDIVYEQRNYNNDWSGRASTGVLLPDGTFYYLIKLNAPNTAGGDNIIKGAILIKR